MSVLPLDLRGSEKAGIAGPQIKAPVKVGVSYLQVKNRGKGMEAYDRGGTLLSRVPCLARGQVAGNAWRHTDYVGVFQER